VFQQNLFHGRTSKSGNGSSIDQTHQIAHQLPGLVSRLNVKSILDIPCGDLEWMSKVELGGAKYLGADVAPSLISYLQSQFPEKEFAVLDISKDSLPKVDLIFCRDLLVHLSNRDIQSALKNIKASDSCYLATTTFVNRVTNSDLPIFPRGIAWRTINLQIPPFNFPDPYEIIIENCTENDGAFTDKTIAIWKVKDLP
jgi:hypothetical protein